MLKLNYFSDKQYIQRIQENDKTVLGEIYVKYEKQVFKNQYFLDYRHRRWYRFTISMAIKILIKQYFCRGF